MADDLKLLLENLAETLTVELKDWIDISTKEGIAAIAKGCMAHRNNNGGVIVIGFDNNARPSDTNRPLDVHEAYHHDTIQKIVSKYASDPFETVVRYPKLDGQEYPVIIIPSGVESPVVAMADLATDSKRLIANGTVYAHTLTSGGGVSSAPATGADMRKIMETCFRNRLSKETDAPKLTLKEQAIRFLDKGFGQFRKRIKNPDVDLSVLGCIEIAAILDPPIAHCIPNLDFLNQFAFTRQSGYPYWLSWPGGRREFGGPYVFEEGWESCHQDENDFWRIETEGRFYHLRCRDGFKGSNVYDVLIGIGNVAEVTATALLLGRKIGKRNTNLAMAFRWTGLEGRHFVNPNMHLLNRGRNEILENSKTTTVEFKLSTKIADLSPIVEEAVLPLLALYDGIAFNSETIAGIVQSRLRSWTD